MTNKSLIPINKDELTLSNLGEIFARSGYFQDAKDAAKAVVKIMAGRELGLPPIASMTGINFIKGKVSLSATIMATVLKRHSHYDYQVKNHSETICEIEFLYDDESIGISTFTLDDAKRAKLDSGDNYKKYPRNMMFARAMSNGIRWFCPDILGGPVYTPDELDNEGPVYTPDELDNEGPVYTPDELDNEEIIDIDISNDIGDFVKRLKEYDEQYEEAKTKVQSLAKEELPEMAILQEIKKEYDWINMNDIKEMMK